MNDNKYSFMEKLGRLTASVLILCANTLLIALLVKFLLWIF